MSNLNVYTCNNFAGFWPVGTAAVIIARNRKQAKKMLLNRLEEIGLSKQPHRLELKEVNKESKGIIILTDGNY